MADKLKMSYVQAMKHFFGLKPGQSLMDFANELRTLNENDKLEMRSGLAQNGYEIHDNV